MNEVLKKILIKTKKEVFSEFIGNHISKQKAEGYDFCELKEYEYGEDAKNIDWNISAKMQKPYVKVFHAQRELNIKIVPFLSNSCYFGTTLFKNEIITQIASILGYISIKQGDSFASFIANEDLEICTKKSKQIHNVTLMANKLFDYSCLNKNINYELCLSKLFKIIHHKSIIFLIGDFFDLKDFDLKLLCQKHEVFCIVIRDKFEENLEELDNINFLNPISNSKFEGSIGKNMITNYKKRVEENDRKLFIHLQNCGIRFVKIYTDENPIKKIAKILSI